MEYTRLLIKFTRPIVRELFENTLRNVLEVEIDIEWNHKDNSAQIEIYNFDHNTQNLQTLFMTLGNDFNTSLTIFNVPFFDEFIYKLFENIKSPGVYNAYGVLLQMLINQEIKKEEIPDYLSKVSKEALDMIQVYISTGLNGKLTSELLYVHRNTMIYRINQFVEKTGIDIRQLYNANFVYLLILLQK
mgnify:CR=1 FL=1